MNRLQNLLHDSLISTQHVEKSAILNKEDYSVKATSIGFQVIILMGLILKMSTSSLYLLSNNSSAIRKPSLSSMRSKTQALPEKEDSTSMKKLIRV